LAVDGSVSTNLIDQIAEISASATHLIVSVGGNDGLSRADNPQDAGAGSP
jgi:hypothetical protein